MDVLNPLYLKKTMGNPRQKGLTGPFLGEERPIWQKNRYFIFCVQETDLISICEFLCEVCFLTKTEVKKESDLNYCEVYVYCFIKLKRKNVIFVCRELHLYE